MEEEKKALRTIKEFVNWFEKERDFLEKNKYSTLSKLQEFYVKFRYILEQEPKE